MWGLEICASNAIYISIYYRRQVPIIFYQDSYRNIMNYDAMLKDNTEQFGGIWQKAFVQHIIHYIGIILYLISLSFYYGSIYYILRIIIYMRSDRQPFESDEYVALATAIHRTESMQLSKLLNKLLLAKPNFNLNYTQNQIYFYYNDCGRKFFKWKKFRSLKAKVIIFSYSIMNNLKIL